MSHSLSWFASQLLFKAFQHLTLGGPLNQYEDEIGPYFDTTKAFYKGLIGVAKVRACMLALPGLIG